MDPDSGSILKSSGLDSSASALPGLALGSTSPLVQRTISSLMADTLHCAEDMAAMALQNMCLPAPPEVEGEPPSFAVAVSHCASPLLAKWESPEFRGPNIDPT